MSKINEMNINYEALYEKITDRKPKNKNQLLEFIQLITEMSNNNNSNPLHYDMETMHEYAKIFNRTKELKRILE